MIKAISPLYFNDKKRTAALVSLCSLLNSLLPESQPYKNIYKSFEKFLNVIDLDNWIVLYIFFEINLIKELGYDTNLDSFNNVNDNLETMRKIKIDDYIYDIPSFLIKKEIPKNLSKLIIRKSLIFTRNVLLNKFFISNNIIFPKSRIILENYFN